MNDTIKDLTIELANVRNTLELELNAIRKDYSLSLSEREAAITEATARHDALRKQVRAQLEEAQTAHKAKQQERTKAVTEQREPYEL